MSMNHNGPGSALRNTGKTPNQAKSYKLVTPFKVD